MLVEPGADARTMQHSNATVLDISECIFGPRRMSLAIRSVWPLKNQARMLATTPRGLLQPRNRFDSDSEYPRGTDRRTRPFFQGKALHGRRRNAKGAVGMLFRDRDATGTLQHGRPLDCTSAGGSTFIWVKETWRRADLEIERWYYL